MNELSLNRGKPPSNEEIRYCGRLSDVLFLIWIQKDVVEFHSVEEYLRQLAKKVIPNMKIDFMPYDEPRYRSGLRMEFEDIAVPAGIGGVCSEWYNVPNDVTMVSVQLYLEAWAAAQSGQVVELIELAPFFKQIFKKNNVE